MSKQTIDGVPRQDIKAACELIEDLWESLQLHSSPQDNCYTIDEIMEKGQLAALAKLRALLDAPAKVAPAGRDAFQMSGATLHCNGENPITHTMNGVIVNLDRWTLYAPDSRPVDRPYTTLTKCGDDWATSHRISKGPTFLLDKENWVEDGSKLAKTCDGQTVRIGRDGSIELVQGEPVAYRVVFSDGEKSKWEDGAPQPQDLYDVRDGVIRGVERAYAEPVTMCDCNQGRLPCNGRCKP